LATLLFDMDGLLLDTEREHLLAFLEATETLGIARETDEAFFLTLIGCSMPMTRARVQEYIPIPPGVGTFIAVWNAAADARAETAIPLRPFVAEEIERLSRAGHRLAVVTSTHGARARGHLDKTGLLAHFECVTGGDEVTATKPDPAPYLETAARMGVPPSECYAFEDSDRGITAAVRAGCKAYQIPDLRPAGTPLPDLGQQVMPDLRAALAHIGI